MRRLIYLFVVLLLVGCNTAPDEAPADPLALLTEAATKIRTSETFRLYVEQTGATSLIPLVVGDVEFSFARAQYVAPDQLQATAKLLLVGTAAIEVEIFSRGIEQWYKMPPAGWVKGDFAPGFNPATLIAEDSGFQAALTALESLEYIGSATLEDGTPVFHLRGIANGPDITALVVGLIQSEGTMPVDVYIHRETHYPVRLVLKQPETVTEEEPEPTTWTIDVYDIDAPAELNPPEE